MSALQARPAPPSTGVVRRPPPKVIAPPGSWRYPAVRRSRLTLAVALLGSAAFHAVVLFGPGWPKHKPKAVVEEPVLQLNFSIPVVKELEEPEHAPSDDPAPVKDLMEYAPVLADTPRLVLPTDFVQTLDYSSLIPPPDLSAAKVFTIPPHIRRGEGPAGNIGDILNLADLDRRPEPIVQPTPIFPNSLKREVNHAVVQVEFIVDSAGYVLDPLVIDSTHQGFNDAAVEGVRKWRFRPGMKAGRKVNTRMRVPIVFRLVEGED